MRTAPRFCGVPQGDDSFSYFIFIKDKVMFKLLSFSRAAVLWFSFHYVFNLEYCKQTKDLATFFQEFIFDIAEKSSKTKTATYLTVSSDINKFLEED